MALKFKGLDLTSPLNRLKAGFCASAVNVRAYLVGGFQLRNLLTEAIVTIGGVVNSLARLNDTTPAGPVSGYTLISASTNGDIYNNSTLVGTGFSGNPVSIIPFRPNASVQPWAYIADSAPQGNVTLETKYLINGVAVSYPSNGMAKLRSDGLFYKMGIKEPQVVPITGTGNTTITGGGTLAATTLPWTIAQDSGFNFGQTVGGDGTAPFIINVINASTVTITVTGTATVNGTAGTAPSAAGPTTSTYPGQFTQHQGTGTVPDPSTKVIVGAFLLADGLTIIPHAISPFTAPNPISIGSSVTLNVPANAYTLQIGIDSAANSFHLNSGSFTVAYSVEIEGISNTLNTLGPITAYYWGDSPHSSAVGQYIWKSASDPGGSGPVRSIGNAGLAGPGGTSQSPGFTTGNSFIIDATISGGVASTPGIGSGALPANWTTLNPDGSIAGSKPVFTPQLESEGYQDFNVCMVGVLFVPAPGTYTFTLSNKDSVQWGIGGGATWTGKGSILGQTGQTETVVSGLPLLPVTNTNDGGGYSGTSSVAVTFVAAGQYPIEIDWDYWFHSGRIVLLTASPTPGAPVATIPPLPQAVRTEVSYWEKYRSSATGAQSNPGPASTPQTTPVISNTVTSPWSNDPQVDKVDYYRQDEGLANPTYVATGPNDGLGPVIGGVIYNTPITDALTDLQAAGNPIMQLDDFEPFPSIDLPKSGVVNVSAGVISLVSGDQFDLRWLAGTIILIGSPTQLAYTLIARPTSTTTIGIPTVPDGTNLVYNIAEPILAAQPLPYLFGPTDNINFTFGVGDPLRPGTLYWCKGNNLDSAPDTNQQDVTDPSEALVNGAMSGGRGVLFSIKRAWIIMPNFFNATATATGTTGSTWSLQATSINRGLFIPRCVAVEGGGKIFFRVDDGIHFSPGGLHSKSITDPIYPLFPHEGSTPQPITRLGVTYYPPDDTLPQKQQFSIVDNWLYYDYQGTDGNLYTLVYDIENAAWVLDIYTPSVTIHASNAGESQQGTLAGCSDGTVRSM